MYYRYVAKLLQQTRQQINPDTVVYAVLNKAKYQCFKHDNNAIVFCKYFHRGLRTSVKKVNTNTDEKDENKTRPQSLIVKKLLQSHQPSQNDAKEKEGRNHVHSVNDYDLSLERLMDRKFASLENERILKTSEPDNLEREEDHRVSSEINSEDFLEDVVLLQPHLCTQTKPSPLLGTEDQSVPASNVPCVGCGALLHCQHSTMPGFLPSERFKLLSESELRSSICQRCYYIQHCDAFKEVKSNPEDYAKIISQVKPTRSAILMVVDVMDIQGSIVPDLMTYVGDQHPLIVVGNKADLLAPDSTDYLVRTRKAITQACRDAGLGNIRKVTLISAKTGFGVERLITMLLTMYRSKVDVFIVGTANAGKSSLFNTLLSSDYCKIKARSLIQRATVSVWPGTTLNLLKFPIMRPSSRTLALRHKRLSQEAAIRKEMLIQQKEMKKLYKKAKEESWELKESVSTTDVRTKEQIEKDNSGKPWGQEVFAYKGGGSGSITPSNIETPFNDTFDDSQHTNSYWVYDTPGVINSEQTFNLLEPKECPPIQPVSVLQPRCVILKPGTTMFISGLARLDYTQGMEAIMTTVHCGPDLPIQMVSTHEADQYYLKHLGTEQLRIPMGCRERLDRLPSMVGKDITLKGEDDKMAVADIQLSSIGWVSVAPRYGCEAKLRAYTPGRKGICLRVPSLAPRFGAYKGKKISRTPFFWPKRVGSAVKGKYLSGEEEV